MRNLDVQRLLFVGFILSIGWGCLLLGIYWGHGPFFLLSLAYNICGLWAVWITR